MIVMPHKGPKRERNTNERTDELKLSSTVVIMIPSLKLLSPKHYSNIDKNKAVEMNYLLYQFLMLLIR